MSDKFGWQKLARKEAAKRGRKKTARRKKPAKRQRPERPTGTMPFGKYRGQAIASIPADYLEWALRTLKLQEWLRKAMAAVVIKARLSQQNSSPPKNPPVPQASGELRGRYVNGEFWGQDYVPGPATDIPWEE
jgi:hypothetical protein